VYRHYQDTLILRNQIDFADMINNANFLLAEMQKQDITLSYKYMAFPQKAPGGVSIESL
jgi:hypothetical protein